MFIQNAIEIGNLRQNYMGRDRLENYTRNSFLIWSSTFKLSFEIVQLIKLISMKWKRSFNWTVNYLSQERKTNKKKKNRKNSFNAMRPYMSMRCNTRFKEKILSSFIFFFFKHHVSIPILWPFFGIVFSVFTIFLSLILQFCLDLLFLLFHWNGPWGPIQN